VVVGDDAQRAHQQAGLVADAEGQRAASAAVGLRRGRSGKQRGRWQRQDQEASAIAALRLDIGSQDLEAEEFRCAGRQHCR